MSDPERLAGEPAETRAERYVEAVERNRAETVGVASLRQHHPGQYRGMQARIEADGLEAPCRHGAPGRLAITLVSRENVLKAFLVEHVDGDIEAVEQVRRGGRGEEAVGVGGNHLLPRPELLGRLGLARKRKRFFADGVEAEAGRQHQSLLRAGNADVDAPFIVTVVRAGEPRNSVDQEQSGMARCVDRLADFVDPRSRPC